MIIYFILEAIIILACCYTFYKFQLRNDQIGKAEMLQNLQTLQAKEQFISENYSNILAQMESKTTRIATLEAELRFKNGLEEEKILLGGKLEKANYEMIKMQERLASQERLESDLKLLLENAKLEITNQNRMQYSLVVEKLIEKNKEGTKETTAAVASILEKDIKETMVKLQQNLNLQQERLMSHQKPIEFFTKILSGSKESGTHGEQTIANQLDNMGLKYGIDYFTQVAGRGMEDERLLADVVILIPNSGKKDVLIIDSKSSTKLGADTPEFMASIEASVAVFTKKDYKTAVEKKLKDLLPNVQINQTHLFVYLPFDRMLSRISEEKPELLKKIREKDVGILTPVILDFLFDTIKLYSAKIELNEKAEQVMEEVKVLIARTGIVLEFIKDLGKSIELSSKKYSALKSSVIGRFVPIVNKMAKPLNVKQVAFDDLNEEDLKQIETKD